MSVVRSKAVLGFVCFVMGAGAVLAAQKVTAERQKTSRVAEEEPRIEDDDFFAGDPFRQMREIRKRFMKEAEQRPGRNVGEIKKREDKNYVYYDVAVKGLDKPNFNLKIEDGQISISGRVETKSESNGNGIYSSSSFQQSFPIPPDVDEKGIQVEQGEDLVTLKFPKLAASA
jgi:HSP20 family molecular chaperone IbpA